MHRDRKSGHFASPAQPELNAINTSMERQSKLATLRRRAFLAAEWYYEQIE